jgi:hypothetical protein
MKSARLLALAASALALSAFGASAAVVCNDEGDCWRVKKRVEYKPDLHLHVYGDNWKWKHGEKYRWREAHGDRGYWRGGVWINID